MPDIGDFVVGLNELINGKATNPHYLWVVGWIGDRTLGVG